MACRPARRAIYGEHFSERHVLSPQNITLANSPVLQGSNVAVRDVIDMYEI